MATPVMSTPSLQPCRYTTPVFRVPQFGSPPASGSLCAEKEAQAWAKPVYCWRIAKQALSAAVMILGMSAHVIPQVAVHAEAARLGS